MVRAPINDFINFIGERCDKGDGFIDGACGQFSKKITKLNILRTQYNNDPKKKEIIENTIQRTERVWGKGGLPVGYYKELAKINISAVPHIIFSDWCFGNSSTNMEEIKKGAGTVVFKFNKEKNVYDKMAYLEKPINLTHHEGDWYAICESGVGRGIVRIKLNMDEWDAWGMMTKFFDYGFPEDEEYILGERTLKLNSYGNDVKNLQELLISQGYSCGLKGCSGYFDIWTAIAVKTFQLKHNIPQNEIYDELTHKKLFSSIMGY